VTNIVLARDGRRLAVEEWGAADGAPVFLMHGTPGSRFGPRPRGSVLYRLGVRLIATTGPGTATPIGSGRGWWRSGGGRSGGGPHPLACACLLGDRVRCAAVLIGMAALMRRIRLRICPSGTASSRPPIAG
jgi:hypothetical protein